MNDILNTNVRPGGVQAVPERVMEDTYCRWHDALTWDCHCGQEVPVQIRVYLKEDVL